MNETAARFAPVGLFLVIAPIMGLIFLSIGALFRPNRPTREKSMPYECGMDQAGDPNRPHHPRYAFMAMLLVLFDVEAAFLVPWALGARELGPRGLAVMILFLGVLFVGYAYLWRRGDLEWE
jgi:NADH-quinone oxidoreductase subunit A